MANDTVKDMNKQLREQMIKVLDAATEEGHEPFVRFKHEYAFQLLSQAGYIDPSNARTTLKGHKFLEQLKHPKRAWLQVHWFAASIAFATILFAGVSAGVQLVDMLTS